MIINVLLVIRPGYLIIFVVEDVSGVKNRELYGQRRRTGSTYDFQIRCTLG